MALTKIGVDAIEGAIGTTQLEDGAVTSAKIATGGVATVDMADGSVTSLKIANGGIATVDIADGAITTEKIAAGAVVTADLADGAVTTSKITDSSVTAAKIASGAAVSNIGYTPVNKAGDNLTNSTFQLSNFISLQATDVNGYPRFNGNGSSAQLGFFRSSGGTEGGMYVGANGDEFAVWDSNFNRRLIVSQAGRVTMPNQPMFMAQGDYATWASYGNNGTRYVPTNSTGAANGTVSGNNAGFGMTASGGLRFNVGSHYNPATGIFTAPVGGKYFFFASGLWRRSSATVSDYSQIILVVNGSVNFAGWDQQPYLYSGSSGMEWVHKISCFVDLAANDQVSVRFEKSGSIEAYAQRYIFGGHLVG